MTVLFMFQLYGAKLAEMEEQHQMLESNLKKFLDLKKEMRSFQREAEESDRVVNDFIKVGTHLRLFKT